MNDRLSPLKFLTAYNKRGATKNIQCPDKPLRCKAFRASFTLSAAGHIGAADSALAGNLPLGTGRPVVQAVAQGDDHSLSRRQAGLDALADLGTGVPRVQVLQHVVVYRDDVHQRQRSAVSRRLQRVGEGYLALELALGPEVHQDLVRYPHTLARQDRPSHRQAAAGGRYRPHRGHRRQRGKYVPSPHPKRCP